MLKRFLMVGVIFGMVLIGMASATDFGPWSISTVDQTGDVGQYTSLVLNFSDSPRISYFDKTHGDLKFASWDESSWKIETVDGASKINSDHPQKGRDSRYTEVGEYSSLTLDGNGTPKISYFDKTHGDLKFAAWNGTSWEIEAVDSNGNVGEFTSLNLDINSDPRIAYYDRTNNDLKFAAWDGAQWQINTVDSTKKVGTYTSLALDSAGDAHISYYDSTNRDLKYASGTGHVQRGQIAMQLYGKDITWGEYLEKVSPILLENLSPDAKQRVYSTKIDWHNTFDNVSSETATIEKIDSNQIVVKEINAKSSSSQGIPILLGDSKLTERSKSLLRSWSKSFAVTEILKTPYTPEWISVETHLQRADNPPGLFTTWEDIGYNGDTRALATSVETQVDVPITKSGYYRVQGVHALQWDNPAPCGSPICTDLMFDTTIVGEYYINPNSNPLVITPILKTGGSISPSNPVTVVVGGSQTFTITPDSNYIVTDVIVDGVSKGAISTYTFNNVQADHTISATFKQQSLPAIVPLCQAGIPFDNTVYPMDTPQSDPMIFTCNWDGNGRVYISGSNTSLTGVYADDGFIITIQPNGTTFDAAEHWAHQHPVLELTSGMTSGSNTMTLIARNWMGLSMSYGVINGVPMQTPWIIEVNSPTVSATAAKISTATMPSFITLNGTKLVANGTTTASSTTQ